jgi:hypothetical protein
VDPLSEKSWKFCGPSTVVAHDEPVNRSVDGSVWEKEKSPLEAIEGWEKLKSLSKG